MPLDRLAEVLRACPISRDMKMRLIDAVVYRQGDTDFINKVIEALENTVALDRETTEEFENKIRAIEEKYEKEIAEGQRQMNRQLAQATSEMDRLERIEQIRKSIFST
ncbi:MAG TPA: hypothetical protein VJB99_01310 [Patescibacteria group bacterium]|nr:hypothetical protein [Patescibacteria group bacterium]